MTEDRAALVELVDKWRLGALNAKRLRVNSAMAMRWCADDLEQALALPQPVASDDPVAEMLRWSFIAQAQQTRANKAEQRAEDALALLRECRGCLQDHLAHLGGLVTTHELIDRIDALTEAAP